MRSLPQRLRRRSLSSYLFGVKDPSRTATVHRFPIGVEGMELRLLLTTTYSAINMFNNAQPQAELDTTLNSGGSFTTSFLGTGSTGTGDVTITSTSTGTPYAFWDRGPYVASPTSGGPNPSFISNFVGSPEPTQEPNAEGLQATGDGPKGIQGTLNSPSSYLDFLGAGDNDTFTINFQIPIGHSSKIVFNDIDDGERVSIQAYDPTGKSLDLDTWSESNYAGASLETPTPGLKGWPEWFATGGNGTTTDKTVEFLSEQDDTNINGDLDVLTPAANVSVGSLTITESTLDGKGQGGVGYQVLSPGSSLSATSSSVAFGATASLAATLLSGSGSASGSPLVGAPVIFNLDEGGGNYVYVGTALTDSNGNAKLPIAIPRGLTANNTYSVMAIYSGDPTDSPATAYGNLTVDYGVPSIIWPTPAAIPYGTALDSTELNASASVLGTFTYTPIAGTIPQAGQTTLLAAFTPSDSIDYLPVNAMVPITVLQVTPTINWPSPAPIVYGTQLSSAQLNASATAIYNGKVVTVLGKFNYQPIAGTILKLGSGQKLSATFTPTDTVDYLPVNNISTIINVVVLTSTSLSIPATSVTLGRPVTLSASVVATPGTGTPTGSVTFSNGLVVLDVATLDGNAHASFTTSTLTLGTHSITATYSGNTIDPVSSSLATSLYVGDGLKNDFDGDGKADLAVYGPDPKTGLQRFEILTSSTNFNPSQAIIYNNNGYGFGNSSSIPVPADYFGDGRSAYAVWTPNNFGGMTFTAVSSVSNKVISFNFGETSNVPVIADVDGDGKADFGVFGYQAGLGYRFDFLLSSKNFNPVNQYVFNNNGYGYGNATSIPVVADFDGNGHADLGLFTPSIYGSTFSYVDVPTEYGFTSKTIGTPNDIPMAVDFDGDGKADLELYGPDPTKVNHERYLVLTAASGFNTANLITFDNNGYGYGNQYSIPVMADYDGTGKADFGVFTPDFRGGMEYIYQTDQVGSSVVADFATLLDLPLTAPAYLIAKKVRGS